ncbi:uncharacterized protein N7443_005006 [Penicillium atrosanguineum]|uniref:uncharacterized protein n=1 Tax=Penicillium atrosanguineum TaxID=1132637 RepID=UPI00238BE6AD|nr:uncharacterized protein N7443_005006 [Penicillium atrosanguineum]KAJ5305346.1 hypothetical protein N7443_005006 [Penicillium atrosanguineum]
MIPSEYWPSSMPSQGWASMISSKYWDPATGLTMKYQLNVFNLSRPPGAHEPMNIVLLIFGFIFIIIYNTRHEVPIYQRKFHKKKIYLYVHIFTGLTEAILYRLRETFQGRSDLLPHATDVLSCFIWGWTSLELVKTLRRGDPRTTRPPYQAAAVLRPMISLISYLFSIPSLHRLSISALDSFFYARLAITFFSYTPYIRSYRGSTIYAISIPLAAALSIHESRVPGASLVFIFATAYIKGLNGWVTHQSHYLRG